jgi:hypothetical protein
MDWSLMLKRMTVCKIINHRWVPITYPGSEGSGRFLRCLRCGKEDHKTSGRSAGGLI